MGYRLVLKRGALLKYGEEIEIVGIGVRQRRTYMYNLV